MFFCILHSNSCQSNLHLLRFGSKLSKYSSVILIKVVPFSPTTEATRYVEGSPSYTVHILPVDMPELQERLFGSGTSQLASHQMSGNTSCCSEPHPADWRWNRFSAQPDGLMCSLLYFSSLSIYFTDTILPWENIFGFPLLVVHHRPSSSCLVLFKCTVRD